MQGSAVQFSRRVIGVRAGGTARCVGCDTGPCRLWGHRFLAVFLSSLKKGTPRVCFSFHIAFERSQGSTRGCASVLHHGISAELHQCPSARTEVSSGSIRVSSNAPPKTMGSSETLVLLSGYESKKGCQIVFDFIFVFLLELPTARVLLTAFHVPHPKPAPHTGLVQKTWNPTEPRTYPTKFSSKLQQQCHGKFHFWIALIWRGTKSVRSHYLSAAPCSVVRALSAANMV